MGRRGKRSKTIDVYVELDAACRVARFHTRFDMASSSEAASGRGLAALVFRRSIRGGRRTEYETVKKEHGTADYSV